MALVLRGMINCQLVVTINSTRSIMRLTKFHCISLGIPVIVWQQAAIAEMVQKLGLGIVIAGIEEIDHKLGELTDEEMLRMKNNVLSFSCLLRSGIFTRTALVDSEVKYSQTKGKSRMTQSMITKKLSAIVQISELDQMLAEMNQTIEQRDSKIERLKQMISEKNSPPLGIAIFYSEEQSR